MKQAVILTLAMGVLLSGCVSMRQMEEVQSALDMCKSENDELIRANEALSVRNTELEGTQANQEERLKALESDTTVLGTSLRHMRSQYDKINELNDILSSKNSKLLGDAAEENRKLLAELEITRTDLQKKEDDLALLESRLNEKEDSLNVMSSELASRSQRLAELETLLAEKDAAANALKKKVSDALLGFKDKGLTIEERNGKVYVSLEAKLLFPSGSTVINSEGQQALINLARAVEDQKDLEIIVEGHTDTDQIRSNKIPSDNWELSVLRSTAVVKIMLGNSNIDPKLLSAAGRSEYHPVDPEDKAKNRRIEIVLSPDLGELYKIIE